jgi:hypothetical protein
MPKSMFTIQGSEQKPTLDEVRQRYGFAREDLDESFGVIEVDSRDHTYAVLAEHGPLARLTPETARRVEGPFANPKIAPFGSPID